VPHQAGGGLLARGAAAEILAAQQDAARGDLLLLQPAVEVGVVGEGELGRLGGEHRGHEPAGVDDVGGDVVSEFAHDLGHGFILLSWDR